MKQGRDTKVIKEQSDKEKCEFLNGEGDGRKGAGGGGRTEKSECNEDWKE